MSNTLDSLLHCKSVLPVLALMAGVLGAAAVEPIPDSCKTGGFAVGCQAWTWNRYTVFEAIEKTAACGGKVIELYPGQKFSPDGATKFDHNASAEQVAQV